MRKTFFGLGLVALLSAPVLGLADDHRLEKKFGVYASVLGDPVVSLLGLNAAYNVTDYCRLTGGFGFYSLDSSTTDTSGHTLATGSATGGGFGMGVKFLVPHWEFSPVAGLNLSYTSITLTGNDVGFFSYSPGSTSLNMTVLYPSLGFDYQAKDGLDLGLAVSFLDILASNPPVLPQGLLLYPGLSVGKFF